MSNCYRLLAVTFLIVLPCGVMAHDPGVSDMLRIEANPLRLEASQPMVLSICNDSTIVNFDASIVITSLDSGQVRYDSVRFVGRLADPSVLPFRIVNPRDADGVSPDTLIIACLQNAFNALPPGDGPVMELFFTGRSLGSVRVDISSATLGGIDFVHLGAGEYQPSFSAVDITVVRPNQPPELALSNELPLVATSGEQIGFEVLATSPSAIPVQVSLGSFTATDDVRILPATQPVFIAATNSSFRWNPGYSDVGIWTARFEAVDSVGLRTVAEVEIQVVADESFLVRFERGETRETPLATCLAHGEFDGDPWPELLISANPTYFGPPLSSYEFIGYGRLSEIFSLEGELYARGLATLYFDDDQYLDAVLGYHQSVAVLRGNGQAGFSLDRNQPELPAGARGAALLNYDGDAFLDYVVAGSENIIVYRRSSETRFEAAVTLMLRYPALTINSADFNGDGFDDLAVGTTAGLDIYLNDSEGGFTPGDSYDQTFGTANIEVTSCGSDFNGDGVYDLCLATPSIGGESSELLVYLGRPDGTFEQNLVRTIKGQVFSTRPGDFNGDAILDIAWINGARGYLAISFGEGDGSFVNERRYEIPGHAPRQIDCVDFDLDGDLDVLVAAHQLGAEPNSSLFLFENQLDPLGISRVTMKVRANDNADIRLQTPSGGRLSRVVNSIASGDYYLRKYDDNDILDAEVVIHTLETGRYNLSVEPRPGQLMSGLFSLSYQVDDHEYRLALDQPMVAPGYVFPLYPAGVSPVNPRQGEFIQTALPTFEWESEGVERFELAADIGFTDILASAAVSSGLYTPQVVLPRTDSTAYYWRVRTEAGPEVTPIYAFNVVRAPTDVEESETPIGLPDSCHLAQNYPNPFNPVTTVEYYLPEGSRVRITIHNVLGQLIRTLIDQPMPSGTHTVEWDATDLYDRPVASGIYFYRMEVVDFTSTRKMVLVR